MVRPSLSLYKREESNRVKHFSWLLNCKGSQARRRLGEAISMCTSSRNSPADALLGQELLERVTRQWPHQPLSAYLFYFDAEYSDI